MKKFVRYLYEYRGGKRVQNVGFVKVEMSGKSTVIQIYGKGFPATIQPLEIFLFYMNGVNCVGIPVGHMRITGQMSSHRLEYTDDGRVTEGIILKGNGRNGEMTFAGIWDERVLDVEHMMRKEFSKEEVQIEEPQIDELPIEDVQLEEPAEAVIMEEPKVYKITRKDLAKLPRKEWKLANNHFLMHGCRNFHHLISFEKDGSYWLGIPGIYHPNELRAAEAFGFGQFMKPDEGEITLTEDEFTNQGEFGYWCRTVAGLVR